MAKKPLLNIMYTSLITLTCECSAVFSGEHYYNQLERLYAHVQEVHPELMQQIILAGRELARSRNGCGYFDTDTTDGWHKAPATFREAWTRTALAHLCNLQQPF